jgi:hypothetical protein
MDETHAVDRRAQVETRVQELCRLLEEQIGCVREGHLAESEQWGERANALVAEITRTAGTDPQGMGADRERVQKLYAQLRLALLAQREETWAALQAVRRGKRMVRTYGNHISPV